MAGGTDPKQVMEMQTECNVCGGNITIPSDVIQGEIVSCQDCGLDFEVESLKDNTVILRTAEEIKEDWGE